MARKSRAVASVTDDEAAPVKGGEDEEASTLEAAAEAEAEAAGALASSTARVHAPRSRLLSRMNRASSRSAVDGSAGDDDAGNQPERSDHGDAEKDKDAGADADADADADAHAHAWAACCDRKIAYARE